MAKWSTRNVADPPIPASRMGGRRERKRFKQWIKRSGEHPCRSTRMPDKQDRVPADGGAPAHYAAPSPNRKE